MRFRVQDMTCGSCARHIQEALKRQDTSSSVTVDMKSKIVEVQTSLSQDKVSEIIQNEGYSPVLVTN